MEDEGKARKSEIYPRERGRLKCSIMIRLWAYVKMGVENLGEATSGLAFVQLLPSRGGGRGES